MKERISRREYEQRSEELWDRHYRFAKIILVGMVLSMLLIVALGVMAGI
jgi:hypothetical protein